MNLIIVRASILADKKAYLCDYTSSQLNYELMNADEPKGPFSFNVDRQNVAQAFLDLAVESSSADNRNVSVFDQKRNAIQPSGSGKLAQVLPVPVQSNEIGSDRHSRP